MLDKENALDLRNFWRGTPEQQQETREEFPEMCWAEHHLWQVGKYGGTPGRVFEPLTDEQKQELKDYQGPYERLFHKK